MNYEYSSTLTFGFQLEAPSLMILCVMGKKVWEKEGREGNERLQTRRDDAVLLWLPLGPPRANVGLAITKKRHNRHDPHARTQIMHEICPLTATLYLLYVPSINLPLLYSTPRANKFQP